jgi:CheY-like chemotaxis protein
MQGGQRLQRRCGRCARTVHAPGYTASPYDMVLMDYHLNQDNGLQLITELRSLARTRFPAALITAERSAEVQQAAEAAGVVYMRKPVRPAILRNVLATARHPAQAAE